MYAEKILFRGNTCPEFIFNVFYGLLSQQILVLDNFKVKSNFLNAAFLKESLWLKLEIKTDLPGIIICRCSTTVKKHFILQFRLFLNTVGSRYNAARYNVARYNAARYNAELGITRSAHGPQQSNDSFSVIPYHELHFLAQQRNTVTITIVP